MPKKTTPPPRTGNGHEVDAFIATLDHPCKDMVVQLRRIIRDADPRIGEGIKWNVPSFLTTDYFATLHLRMKQGVGVILHFGAKKTPVSATGVEIADPQGLLVWLAKDRAVVGFADPDDLEAKRTAFSAIVRDWIGHLARAPG